MFLKYFLSTEIHRPEIIVTNSVDTAFDGYKLMNEAQQLTVLADPVGCAVKGLGLLPFSCWGYGFDSHRGAWMSVLSVVYCPVEVCSFR